MVATCILPRRRPAKRPGCFVDITPRLVSSRGEGLRNACLIRRHTAAVSLSPRRSPAVTPSLRSLHLVATPACYHAILQHPERF
ncbi:hypothetical protein F2Q70_00028507 [Brassica cretica]|uniref:Uncharacterized protein n=1 Tax=Brassica cretica TaxID=69181 RepID=A0A8S9L2D8_BRACR|nr:hypothetical protein F2Q70_00028507 [Brassica cretica]